MAEQPVLDQLNTRLLESREVTRSFVKKAEVARATATGLLLRTSAETTTARTRLPKERDEAAFAASARVGTVIPGSIRLDVISDSILRVRYAEGEEIPENQTPMLVGCPNAPSASEVAQEGGRVRYTTPKLRVEVGLEPFTLRVATADGREVRQTVQVG